MFNTFASDIFLSLIFVLIRTIYKIANSYNDNEKILFLGKKQ